MGGLRSARRAISLQAQPSQKHATHPPCFVVGFCSGCSGSASFRLRALCLCLCVLCVCVFAVRRGPCLRCVWVWQCIPAALSGHCSTATLAVPFGSYELPLQLCSTELASAAGSSDTRDVPTNKPLLPTVSLNGIDWLWLWLLCCSGVMRFHAVGLSLPGIACQADCG